MYLRALRSAFPGEPISQVEVFDALCKSPAVDALSRRGVRTLQTLMRGQSGVSTRHFAIPLEKLFRLDAQGLNEAFECEAPPLGVRALDSALKAAGLKARELDAVFVCTCTGYLCPGITSHMAGLMPLRNDAELYDFVGLGCGALIPTWHAARCFLAAHPEAVVATVAVELSSSAFFLSNDSGVLISTCLFGDGASASIWDSGSSGSAWSVDNFHTLHIPEQREKVRLRNHSGGLRNQLARDIPDVVSTAVKKLYKKYPGKPDAVIAHSGGRDVIEALEKNLHCDLSATSEVLASHGNMSSASLPVALEHYLRTVPSSTERIWLTAFGTGFSAYACELGRSGATAF